MYINNKYEGIKFNFKVIDFVVDCLICLKSKSEMVMDQGLLWNM